jgi:hypothetical protein
MYDEVRPQYNSSDSNISKERNLAGKGRIFWAMREKRERPSNYKTPK